MNAKDSNKIGEKKGHVFQANVSKLTQQIQN